MQLIMVTGKTFRIKTILRNILGKFEYLFNTLEHIVDSPDFRSFQSE